MTTTTTTTYWLTHDATGYWLWPRQPSQIDGIWSGVALALQREGWNDILPMLCPREDRVYRLTVLGCECTLSRCGDYYWLRCGPFGFAGKRILPALVPDGGCVRISVEVAT